MDYIIQETDGQFEIAQVTPVVIGRFTDQAIAVRVLEMLVKDANAEITQKLEFPVLVVEAETPPKPDAPAPERPVTLKPAPLKPVPEKAKPVTAKPVAWENAELEVAFARLKKGEKLQVVADDFGKSWTSLRSRWAGRKSAQAKKAREEQVKNLPAIPASTVTTAIAAIGELKDQPNCNICGRRFTLTPENIDQCPRCSDGAP